MTELQATLERISADQLHTAFTVDKILREVKRRNEMLETIERREAWADTYRSSAAPPTG
jgi:hypothetical protein